MSSVHYSFAEAESIYIDGFYLELEAVGRLSCAESYCIVESFAMHQIVNALRLPWKSIV